MKRSVQVDRFSFEREWRAKGITLLAGVDEAGRGPLAGPVVAAAVCLPPHWLDTGLPESLRDLNDSKQLTALQRDRFFDALTTHPEVRFGIAEVSAEQIDQINILRATHLAMNLTLEKLEPAPQHVLVDGNPVKSMRLPHTAIVKGDSRSYSIAAASVLAKVTRDRLMLEYHRLYPVYGFAEHKGYGTPQHLAALCQHGPCPIHRHSFQWRKPVQNELF